MSLGNVRHLLSRVIKKITFHLDGCKRAMADSPGASFLFVLLLFSVHANYVAREDLRPSVQGVPVRAVVIRDDA